MKKLLVISPYFPPANAADMHRIRTSLPYFSEFGWEAEVVTVEERYRDIAKDHLLLVNLPEKIWLHTVKAFSKKWTSKFGLGSLALRSLYYYCKKVDSLLKKGNYDLIYFSTTQFPVCILGAYWRRRFGVPYVIDMQDPWHSDYYKNKPKAQRPPKYWFSYRLNKYLEPIAMKSVSGLIAVSQEYIATLKKRYPVIAAIPARVITFGAFWPDLEIARSCGKHFEALLDNSTVNLVYIGRGGLDMHRSIRPLFQAVSEHAAAFTKLKLYFIGTSYAPGDTGKPTIMPLAQAYGIAGQVVEITGRISYYHTLRTLQQADALFMPGSDDPRYTASKLYTYLLIKKPLIAIFNGQSSAIAIMKEYGVKHVYDYDDVPTSLVVNFLNGLLDNSLRPDDYSQAAQEKFSAREMARSQCMLFNEVTDAKI